MPDMKVELQRATARDRVALENLLSLYGHDFSEIRGGVPGPDGRYAYPHLARFLEGPGREPFLIRADGSLAGLVFVSSGSALGGGNPDVWDMTEFFVVRGLRRRGVGEAAARAAFRRFPGSWEVRVMDRNRRAFDFWRRAIGRHTQESYTLERRELEPGVVWHVFCFLQPEDPR